MSVALPLSRDRLAAAGEGIARRGRIAAIDVIRDIAKAAPFWRAMQAGGAVATPYQQYDFAALWYHHVGRLGGVAPFIVTALDAGGAPLLLWPFGVTDWGPVRVLGFLGGKYANVNFGLWNRAFAASISQPEVDAVIDHITRGGHGIDLIALQRQPRIWDGLANPFALLPHQQSPNDSRRLDLRQVGPDSTRAPLRGPLRKQLRTKEHRLSKIPGYRYVHAQTDAELDRLLDWFFSVKGEHLAAHGVANVFAERGVERFLREACRQGLAAGHPTVEVHALQTDHQTLAVIAGVGDGARFSSIFTTYTLSNHARNSPGLVLVMRLISNLAARGYAAFDLGVGDARYKRMFCKHPEPLFDNFLPLTPLGWTAGIAARSCNSVIRGIKRRPFLWSAAQRLRRSYYTGRAR